MRAPTRITLALAGGVAAGVLAPVSAAHAADTQPPTVDVRHRAADAAGWHRGTVEVTVTASDRSGIDLLSSSIQLSGATTRTIGLEDFATTFDLDATGVTTIATTVYDNEGNVRRATSTVSIDNEAPSLGLLNLADGAVVAVGDTRRLQFSCADAHSGSRACTVGGTGLGEGGRIRADAPGRYSIQIDGDDNVGNRASRTVSYTVVPEGVRPSIAVTPAIPANAAGWHRAPVDVHVTGTAGHDVVPVTQVRWWTDRDPSVTTVDGAEATLRVAAEGATEVSAVARDVHGADSEDGSRVVRIDSVPPTAQVLDPGFVRQGDELRLAISCDDALSGITSCVPTAGADATGLLDTSRAGTRTVTVRAVDAAGNAATVDRQIEVHAREGGDPDPEPLPGPTTALTAPATVSSVSPVGVAVRIDHEAPLSGGTVEIRSGARVLATAPVPPTKTILASFRTDVAVRLPRLAVGTHRLTAVLVTDRVAGSTSSPVTVTVKTPVTVAAKAKGKKVGRKALRKRTAAVRVAVTGRDAAATGVVRIYRGTKQVGTATLSAKGVAKVRLSGLRKGRHTLRVVYAGSGRAFGGETTLRVRLR